MLAVVPDAEHLGVGGGAGLLQLAHRLLQLLLVLLQVDLDRGIGKGLDVGVDPLDVGAGRRGLQVLVANPHAPLGHQLVVALLAAPGERAQGSGGRSLGVEIGQGVWVAAEVERLAAHEVGQPAQGPLQLLDLLGVDLLQVAQVPPCLLEGCLVLGSELLGEGFDVGQGGLVARMLLVLLRDGVDVEPQALQVPQRRPVATLFPGREFLLELLHLLDLELRGAAELARLGEARAETADAKRNHCGYILENTCGTKVVRRCFSHFETPLHSVRIVSYETEYGSLPPSACQIPAFSDPADWAQSLGQSRLPVPAPALVVRPLGSCANCWGALT